MLRPGQWAACGRRVASGESELWMNDMRGTKRISIVVTNINDLQSLSMNDAAGNQRIYAALDKTGSPVLSMHGHGDLLGPGGDLFVEFDPGGVPKLRVFGPGKSTARGQLSVSAEEGCPPSVRALYDRKVVEAWPVHGLPAP